MPAISQSLPAQAQCIGIFRFRLQRLLEEMQRFGRSAEVMADLSQTHSSLCIGRIDCQRFAVILLSEIVPTGILMNPPLVVVGSGCVG